MLLVLLPPTTPPSSPPSGPLLTTNLIHWFYSLSLSCVLNCYCSTPASLQLRPLQFVNSIRYCLFFLFQWLILYSKDFQYIQVRPHRLPIKSVSNRPRNKYLVFKHLPKIEEVINQIESLDSSVSAFFFCCWLLLAVGILVSYHNGQKTDKVLQTFVVFNWVCLGILDTICLWHFIYNQKWA